MCNIMDIGSIYCPLVDIGSYGKYSGGDSFANRKLGRTLEENSLNIPIPVELSDTNKKSTFLIVGGEAFPLSPNLLRPYSLAKQWDDTSNNNIIYYYVPKIALKTYFSLVGEQFQFCSRKLKTAPGYAEKIVFTR